MRMLHSDTASAISLLQFGHWIRSFYYLFFFFFNDTATTEIYTLSLHDALPILAIDRGSGVGGKAPTQALLDWIKETGDRKSTRLNSSHSQISYAVFCLKKKKQEETSLI